MDQRINHKSIKYLKCDNDDNPTVKTLLCNYSRNNYLPLFKEKRLKIDERSILNIEFKKLEQQNHDEK